MVYYYSFPNNYERKEILPMVINEEAEEKVKPKELNVFGIKVSYGKAFGITFLILFILLFFPGIGVSSSSVKGTKMRM